MKELELTQTKVAADMNIAQPTLSQKINNARPMDLEEAEKLQIILEIPDNEFKSYFFTTESRNAT
ncbi:MAG: helix-turn-helix domain-containing protein [Bacteroides sp.]|nr:helix-turn-helix domain-containing protein [Bacteroides sp.]